MVRISTCIHSYDTVFWKWPGPSPEDLQRTWTQRAISFKSKETAPAVHHIATSGSHALSVSLPHSIYSTWNPAICYWISWEVFQNEKSPYTSTSILELIVTVTCTHLTAWAANVGKRWPIKIPIKSSSWHISHGNISELLSSLRK